MSEALIDELVEAWRTHNRINLFLLERISHEGLACSSGPRGGGRVWKQFAHMHTIRAYKLENWHKPLSLGLPKYGGEDVVPREELIAAFQQSGEAVERFFRLAAAGETKKRGFKKGLMTSLAYLVSHESHHRGNVLLTLKLSATAFPRRIPTPSGTGTGCRAGSRRSPGHPQQRADSSVGACVFGEARFRVAPPSE